MKLKTILPAATVLIFMSLNANAALVHTDWLESGDQQATLDESTGLEWLNLSNTDSMSVAQVNGLLNSTFSGWRLPSPGEVLGLLSGFYDNIAFESNVNITTYDQADMDKGFIWGDMVGNTNYVTLEGHAYSLALHLNDEGDVVYSGSNVTDVSGGSNNMLMVMSEHAKSTDVNYADQRYGVYLVSDGGTTLSSILDPSINVVAGDASAVADVAVGSLGWLAMLSSAGLFYRRRKASNV